MLLKSGLKVEYMKNGCSLRKFLSLKDIRRDIPEMTLDEYLGGLGDFTGEVGRFAVAAATRRDKAMVKKAKNVVMTVTKILLHINMNGKVPSRMSKENFDAKK